MKNKRICLLIAGIGFLLSPYFSVHAQGTLSVVSTPAGAEARLSGEAVVNGVTPVLFQQPLVGKYTLTVKKKGYETYKTDLLLDPTRQQEVTVTLSKKTRLKAFARSLIIPGWGQRYGDQKVKGYTYTVFQLLTVVGYLIADNDFDLKYDKFTKARQTYDSLSVHGNYQELQALYPYLIEKQNDAYDAENLRRITIGSVVGVYALSLIDALFFFPEEKGTFSIKNLALEPSTDFTQPGLTLTYSF